MAAPSPRHPRDFGGTFSINNPDDGSPIREMISLGARMLIVTDKCTYAMQMADQIIRPEQTRNCRTTCTKNCSIMARSWSYFVARSCKRGGYLGMSFRRSISLTRSNDPWRRLRNLSGCGR